MHGVLGTMGKRDKAGPVAINYLKLDYADAPKNSPEAKRIREINKLLGRASRDHQGHETGPSPLTAFRLRSSPVALLLDKGRIGGEEHMAAQEIEEAFMAISGASMFKPLNMERVQGGRAPDWPDKTANAVKRYQNFANHWSMRKKQYADRTLEVLVSAVIDQRPFSVIEADVGLRHGLARKIVIRGLRDYAARAGWVERKTAAQWKAEAGNSFPAHLVMLAVAMAKAKTTR